MKGFNFINVAPLLLLLAVSLVSEVESYGCYSCWSNETAECATGPIVRVETVDCPETDTCLTAIVNGVTFRGCSSLIPSDFSLRTTCNREFCNNDPFPEDRLICYKCKGLECSSPSGKSRPCLIFVQNDTCYIDVANVTEIRRGCMSDGNFTATENTIICNSSYCNHIPSISIYDTPVLLGCKNTTNGTDAIQCSEKNCFDHSSQNKLNCTLEESSSNTATSRSFSTSNETKPLKCYKCNGEKPCTELSPTDHPQDCPIYGRMFCFQYITDNKTMIRGCLTNTTKGCDEAKEKCFICDKDGCNNRPWLKPSNLSCIQCGNSENCPWAFDASNGTRCNGNVYYYQNDSCYIDSKKVARMVVTRGCTSDGKCQVNGTTCNVCSGINCNTANHEWQDCLQCSSQNSTQCKDGTYASAPCPGKRITYEERGCYIMTEGNYTLRGCFNTLNNTQREICRKDSGKRCKICVGQNCNAKKVNGGFRAIVSANLFISSIFMILTIHLIFY